MLAPLLNFARVIVDVPIPQPLDYRIPPDLAGLVGAGVRCVVPVGKRQVVGLVVGLAAASTVPTERLRVLVAVLDDVAPLTSQWLKLTEFASTYYQCSWGEVAIPALAPGLRRVPSSRRRVALERQRQASSAPARAADPLTVATPAPVGPPETPWQRLNSAQSAAAGTLAAALAAALDPAKAGGFAPFLLYGVTGSGKTDVYFAAIADALRQSLAAQALLLVPEIGLTPQLTARLTERFPGERLVTLHSAMTDAERTQAWKAAHAGLARIIVGTRLAVFASIPGVRLIVVDEEHDPSFKAGDGIRYSARDLAVKRAQLAEIPIVLGSATPSLETWAHAAAGRYRRIDLPDRAVGLTPAVRMIDLRRPPGAASGRGRGTELQGGLAPAVAEAIVATVAGGGQALVFLNRRGYAPVVSCAACGWLSDCPRCSVFAAFHKVDAVLRCHHCGWQAQMPRACPTCGNQDLTAVGQGTQRVEEALARLLPGARIARIDRDSTRRKDAANDALAAVHDGAVDVLVGTQMIAKGHDFGRIGLVAILNADAQLAAADFRAPERLFALLMQVAGRAGRRDTEPDAGGGTAALAQVLVQTRYPDHPLFRALARHDYAAFAATELALRKTARLPPFVHQALLLAQAPTMAAALEFLQAASNGAAELATADGVRRFDPVPMAVAKLASVNRAQLLIEAERRPALHDFVREWLTWLRADRKLRRVRWQIDIDPAAI